MTERITVVPANQARCEDLRTVFGQRGEAARCHCQRFKTPATRWDQEEASGPVERRAGQLRQQTDCGQPDSPTTSGLVAYLAGKPLVSSARTEDEADERVWSVPCLITRAGYRRRAVTYALARAAVEHARQRGVRAIESYPIITRPGDDITWGELHVGSRSVFTAAGFTEAGHPSLHRVVMRIDFEAKQ